MNFKFHRNCDSLASKCQRHTNWKWSKLLRKARKPIPIHWMNITLPQSSHIIGKASKIRLGRGLITTAWRGQSGECSFVIRRVFFSCAVLESNNNVFLLSPFVITHLLTFYFHQCGLLIALLCTNVALKAIDKNVFFFIILFGCARKWAAKKNTDNCMWITTRELRNKIYFLLFSLFPGTIFKAHKLILAACSKNFADLFETPSLATGSVCVILEATSAENMAALLEFMYKGEVHVSQKALESFLKAAESLQVG